MATVKPYMSTDGLIESIKRRISFPLSSQTFTYRDIVAFLNEELQLNAVPSVKELHEEYFVFDVAVPVVNGVNRYPIPDRSIGMALRDVCYADIAGNYSSMTRISPEDKGYFQASAGTSTAYQFYIKGNEIILAQNMNTGASGNLIFSIFLRPNQLVRDDRAAIIQEFQKSFVVTSSSSIVAGDLVTLNFGIQTQTPVSYAFKAVTSTPGAQEFLIGTTDIMTASNLAQAISAASIDDVTTASINNICVVSYADISSTFSVTSSGITTDTKNLYVKFNGLPVTYTDPDTDVTDALYTNGAKIDFLQTNAGHRTYAFDVKLRQILPGNIGQFRIVDLNNYVNVVNNTFQQICPIKVGDYICLANESIIPQIPPELHTALAERGAARILSAIGDKDGYAMSQAKIQEMDRQQATLIGSRIDGTVRKVFNKNSLLRLGKRTSRRT